MTNPELPTDEFFRVSRRTGPGFWETLRKTRFMTCLPVVRLSRRKNRRREVLSGLKR